MFFNDDYRRIKAEMIRIQSAPGSEHIDSETLFSVACSKAGIDPKACSLADKSSMVEDVKANAAKLAFENAMADKRDKFNRGVVEFRLHAAPTPQEAAKQAAAEDQSANMFRRTSGKGLY